LRVRVFLGAAPAAPHVAPAETDEVGGFPGVESLALNGVEILDRATSCPAQAIVITGGEPLLYPLGVLTQTLRERGLQIFLETSGSHPFSGVFDWVCLSPKRRQPPLDEAFERADELKVIVESEADFEWAEQNAARVGGKCLLFLQPEWSVAEKVMPAIVEYAKAHPRWNISIQTHKYMHIP